MKFDVKTITLILSLLLNALGGTGVVHPVVGGVECPPAPSGTPAH